MLRLQALSPRLVPEVIDDFLVLNELANARKKFARRLFTLSHSSAERSFGAPIIRGRRSQITEREFDDLPSFLHPFRMEPLVAHSRRMCRRVKFVSLVIGGHYRQDRERTGTTMMAPPSKILSTSTYTKSRELRESGTDY